MIPAFKTGYFKTFDSKELFYRVFEPLQAKATLMILHGHGEHSGRYEKFAAYLNSVPVCIAILDLRGNGRSQGDDVYVDSLEDYLKDLDFFIKCLEEKNLPSPFILLGHSLGGLIAVHWAIRNESKIKTLILSSPCLGLRLSPLLIGFNQWIDKINPHFLYSHPVYPPHLTHSKHEIEKYRRDPLIKRKISVRLVREMIRGGEFLDQQNKIILNVPVSILMGDIEKIVSPDAIERFYAKVQAPWKDLQVFKGFYHEIFNEEGQEKVFDALQKTLLKSLS